MKEHINNVRMFQEKIAELVLRDGPGLIDKKGGLFRVRLLQEELDELKEAIEQDDLVEVADALADIQYLIFGTVLSYGLQGKFEDILREVHRSNMTKINKDGTVTHREDGKVVKSDTFEEPKIADILKKKTPIHYGTTYVRGDGQWTCDKCGYKTRFTYSNRETVEKICEDIRITHKAVCEKEDGNDSI